MDVFSQHRFTRQSTLNESHFAFNVGNSSTLVAERFNVDLDRFDREFSAPGTTWAHGQKKHQSTGNDLHDHK